MQTYKELITNILFVKAINLNSLTKMLLEKIIQEFSFLLKQDPSRPLI